MIPGSDKEGMKQVGNYLGLGVQLAATIVLLLYGGKWLDEKYNTGSTWTLTGAVLGVVAGMYNLIKTVFELEKKENAAKKKSGTPKNKNGSAEGKGPEEL